MAKPPRKRTSLKTALTHLNGQVRIRGRNLKLLQRRSGKTPCPSTSPRRTPNLDRRTREYLTPAEVEQVLQASGKAGRHRARGRTLILSAYRHGLRASDRVASRWEQGDFKGGVMHVARLKNGVPFIHLIRGQELRALRKLQAECADTPSFFVTEREGPMTPATARKLIARAGELAKLPFPIPHMLRHPTGYKLANEGHHTGSIQHYLGHRNITHTMRYTELSPDRFKSFWKD